MQEMLDDLTFLPSVDRQKLADRLNKRHKDRMAAMWELVFLWGLSRVGRVDHEAELDNSRRPDLRYELDDLGFIADVTALSDSGLEDQAGVEQFWSDILRIGHKYGLRGNGLSLEVESTRVGAYGDTVVAVHLPKPKDRARVIKTHVEPFLRAHRETQEVVSLVVDEPEVQFTLSYNPGQQYATQIHTAYTVPDSLKNNPLAKRIKVKAGQLRGAPADLPRGLIICDAGSDLMRHKNNLNSRDYSRRDIALAALEATTAIDFVLMVSVVAEQKMLRGSSTFHWHIDFVGSKRAIREGRLADGIAVRIEGVFREMFKRLPPLVNDAMNVAHRVLEAEGPNMIGGYQWEGDMFEISSRAVMDLLAGTLSQNDFQAAYGWHPDAPRGARNPFAMAKSRGQLIKSIEIKASQDSDDDWLVVHFGRPDPAVAPFTGTNTEATPDGPTKSASQVD